MEGVLAGVGVQHRDGAGDPAQLAVVVSEGAQRLPGAAHQQIVDEALVRPGQWPQLRRQGEGDQKVRRGHLLGELAFEPLLTLVVLAVRAVAMAAGVRHQPALLAAAALDLHHGAGLRAAAFQGCQCPIVLRPQLVPVVRQEIRLEGGDDTSQPDHLTDPHWMLKPSIRALIRSSA